MYILHWNARYTVSTIFPELDLHVSGFNKMNTDLVGLEHVQAV